MLRPPKWRDLSLRTKSLLLISAPAGATVLMFGVANWLASRDAVAGDQVIRELEIARQIQQMHAGESETSADVRAYFISSDEIYANRVRDSLAAFDASRLQLIRLTLPAPADQQRLAQIGDLENAREERMFGDMARFRSGILSNAQLQFELTIVQQDRAQIRKLLKLMETDNDQRLAQQRARVQSLRAQQAALTGLCLLFGLVGGTAMTLLFARGISGRIGRLQRNIARLPAGVAPEPIGGHDEIADLNAGLVRIAGVIHQNRTVLEGAPHGIAEVDARGRYLWTNQRYAELAGFPQGRSPEYFALPMAPEDQSRLAQAIAEIPQKDRVQIAAHLHSGAAEPHEVEITLLSGQPACGVAPDSSFLVFLNDLADAKISEPALLRAKEAADASNRARTEFLAKISHDIRTPLNAILGSADLLSQTSLSFDQSEYVNMFQRNCRRLVTLINDFLDFARIEAGAVHVEKAPFRIRETVHDAVATFRESAARKGIVLRVEVDAAAPACALGDPLRIQQILVNLLSNALKFTSSGSVELNVRVLSQASAGDRLCFEVSDSGPGIPVADQEKIFARFVQLPTRSNGQRGTGLGLAICRELVELMGGEIGVLSREGKGSTFYFNLPLEAVDPVIPGSGAAERTSLSSNEPLRILVAEDTEDNRLLLQYYLREEPVKLRMAVNGKEAVEAIRQGEHFDLILMDIDMPETDGYTAAREIRDFQQSAAQPSEGPPVITPIVALSADAMEEAVRASRQAGCVAHVAKPVDRETLLETIRRFAVVRGTPQTRTPSPASVSDQVRALVPHYLASKAKQIEEARTALALRDFGPIRRFGHNLKGTGRGYGFPAIEEMGKEIERAATEADASRIASQLDALHRFVSESAALVDSPQQ